KDIKQERSTSVKLQNVKIKFLEIDLKGCVYLNHFSHSVRIATFFKMISRLGNGAFWYFMLILVWIMQGLIYTVQIVYLILGSTIGTIIYKVLKIKTVRPRPYQVHQVIRRGEHPLDHFSFPSGHTLHAVMATTVLGYVAPLLLMLMLPLRFWSQCPEWCWDCIIQVMWQLAQFWVA